jgi:beta-glucosidase
MRHTKKLTLTLVLFIAAFVQAGETEVYKDAKAPVEERVTDLLSRLTLEEKVALCHGAFASGGVPRLGIDELRMLDGRQGLRPVAEHKGKRTTLLPSVLALSCSWDDEAAREFGMVLAREMLALDHHVLLAPMLNLVRSPLGGRNFENFGEDPYLVGRMGAAYIRGVQEMQVGACACLLVANDCERRRHFTSSNMDERTLRELHLVGYEMSVRDGQVWSMMTGNNLYNGVYCAQNKYLIQDLIKNDIGFDGVMITDWRAAYDTVPTALAGTDMTTGFCSYVFGGGRLLAAVKSGDVPMALLDDKVRRILRLYVRSGVLDPGTRQKGEIDSPAHREAARKLAAQGMVLLKNDRNLLPVESAKIKRILITGPAADTIIQGGGSGSVPAAIEISPLEALRRALPNVTIDHIPFEVPLRPGVESGSVEWEQTPAQKKKARKQGIRPSGKGEPDLKALESAARSADLVIFMAAGIAASEGRDLPHMDLPGDQAQAIAALAQTHKRVIVVLVNNGAVTLDPWVQNVSALLAIHYSGQGTGDALADVLTGKVNPAGKLSYTFGKRLDDFACHAVGEWPARLILDKDPVNPGMKPEDRKATHAFSTDYKEGVFAGYRWFDQKKLDPWFPFGHGLSYTTFKLSGIKVVNDPEGIRVSCSVQNTGRRAGAEVVQVYVAPDKASLPRPPRELKGYSKVMLEPGQSRRIEIILRPAALAYYESESRKWKEEAGTYEIQVGTSSRDIRLKSRVKVSRDRFHDGY